MEILSYRELASKDDLLPLMCLAFGWPFNPEKFEEIAEIDPRLKNSPVGFCALENNRVVGFVGVMDLTTRTIKGEIKVVGGIWGVSTLPSHARRGISKVLMKKAHQHFRDKDYDFCFLTTFRALIAYDFYRKLGYEDAMEFPSAYKLVKKKSLEKKTETSKEVDWKKIAEIYAEFSSDKTGFVVRDENYFRIIQRREKIKPEMILLGEKAYIIFKEEEEFVRVSEFAVVDVDEGKELIRSLEGRRKPLVYDQHVVDERTFRIYQSLGYALRKRSYSLLMVKQLTRGAGFKQVYGEKFFMTGLDGF